MCIKRKKLKTERDNMNQFENIRGKKNDCKYTKRKTTMNKWHDSHQTILMLENFDVEPLLSG